MKNHDKVALITGVTGQDGAYLAEFLLKKGYEVHGIKRRSSLFNTDRIDHLYQDPHVNHQRFKLHYGDLTDSTNLIRIIQQVQPDEIYNLAAMSHVAVSFETPEYTANADAIAQNLTHLTRAPDADGSAPSPDDLVAAARRICEALRAAGPVAVTAGRNGRRSSPWSRPPRSR